MQSAQQCRNVLIGPLLDARARGFIQPLRTFPLDTKIPALYQVLSIHLFLSFYHNPAEQEIISSKKTKAQRLPGDSVIKNRPANAEEN